MIASADLPIVEVRDPRELARRRGQWEGEFRDLVERSLGHHAAWPTVFQETFKHTPFCLEATVAEKTVGLLPLVHVSSIAFGSFLVSLPYLNSVGVLATNEAAATALVDRAVELADELDVRYLELRHEQELRHRSLTERLVSKVHMRLPLPATADQLWSSLKPKVRNQVRKGERHELTVAWGGRELLRAFYDVFSRNMRDLGTPVYSARLFANILGHFSDDTELCVVRLRSRPIAAALLMHGPRTTVVPSASSLRRFNQTNANMLMYWHLLKRAIARGNVEFDFGRCTVDSNTFRFKKQWGAAARPAVWQYYLRRGQIGELRPENGKYERLINVWRRLPVAVTRWIGPLVVRGIP